MESTVSLGAAVAGAQPSSVVFARTLVSGIDMRHPLLSADNVELLQTLSQKHQDYIRHGRGREAHAMASAMLIVWRKFCEPGIPLEPPGPLNRVRQETGPQVTPAAQLP